MKILVTGGAGYIGSHVVNLLGQRGEDEVVVLDNLSTGRLESILFGEFVEGDLGDRSFMEELFKKYQFDGVMHFAGSIIVPESVEKPLKYYKNNSANSLFLLELCKKFNTKYFIFSSTAAVYGTPGGDECFEDTQLAPINPYGHSKLMTEEMLKSLSYAKNDFNYVALRYFNVAGANPNKKIGQSAPISSHLIKIACETALAIREKIVINGTDYQTPDGTCVRDYIHVDDLAQAHLDALSYLEKEKTSNIFNCGYGRGYSVKEVIEAIKSTCNVDFKVEEGQRREGDAEALIANSDKLKDVVGWKPQHEDLSYIVKTAYEWEKVFRKK